MANYSLVSSCDFSIRDYKIVWITCFDNKNIPSLIEYNLVSGLVY